MINVCKSEAIYLELHIREFEYQNIIKQQFYKQLDEELFNGEEPLWFSENSHRISPVRKLDVARNIIRDKLAEEDFEQEVKSYVVIQMANIINADDMFEIWNKMDIDVTRVNRGAPKEIRLFSKTLDDAEAQIDRKELNRLRKVLKSIK